MAAAGDYDFATLEASGVADVAFSPDQTRLYAAMRNGYVNVYDVATRQKIASWQIGVELGGISVSEDGSFLLVIERRPAANSSTFYRVDTGTGAALAVSKPGSAFRDVEIVDADTAVLTGGVTDFTHRQTLYNLQTGAFSALADAAYHSDTGLRTILAEDGHLTLLAEPGISSGPLFLFDDRTNTIVAKTELLYTRYTYSGYNFGSQAISEAAGLVLQFINREVLAYDLGLNFLRPLPLGQLIDGIVFDPTGRFFYIYEIERGYLSKYSVASWSKVDEYYVGTSTWHNDIGYGSQLLITADGTRITIVDADRDIGKLRMVDLTGAGYFTGTSGADTFAGAKGDDIYFVDHAGDVVIENPGEGTDEIRTSLAVYSLAGLPNVENLTATPGTLARDFRGNAGDNAVTGGGGNDTLHGGEGDDTLDGGTGADAMYGGADNDIYIVEDSGDRAIENPDEGTDEVRTGLSAYTLPDNVESLTFTGTGPATLRGNSLGNRLVGGASGDLFRLEDGGDDTALGGGGNDGFLFGAALTAADHVDGGDGAQDQLGIKGNYGTPGGAPFVLGANNLINVEQLILSSGSSDGTSWLQPQDRRRERAGRRAADGAVERPPGGRERHLGRLGGDERIVPHLWRRGRRDAHRRRRQ